MPCSGTPSTPRTRGIICLQYIFYTHTKCCMSYRTMQPHPDFKGCQWFTRQCYWHCFLNSSVLIHVLKLQAGCNGFQTLVCVYMALRRVVGNCSSGETPSNQYKKWSAPDRDWVLYKRISGWRIFHCSQKVVLSGSCEQRKATDGNYTLVYTHTNIEDKPIASLNMNSHKDIQVTA